VFLQVVQIKSLLFNPTSTIFFPNVFHGVTFQVKQIANYLHSSSNPADLTFQNFMLIRTLSDYKINNNMLLTIAYKYLFTVQMKMVNSKFVVLRSKLLHFTSFGTFDTHK